jgi:hypothetical protein
MYAITFATINIFVNTLNSPYPAVNITPHNDRPRMVRIFNNTIISKKRGISVMGGYPEFQQKVIGNVVFSPTPIRAGDIQDNVTDEFTAAGNYLVNPFASPGQLDVYPQLGKVTGEPLATDSFTGHFTEWDKDFNGSRREWVFRGAYSGEGVNPGWLPKLQRKPPVPFNQPSNASVHTDQFVCFKPMKKSLLNCFIIEPRLTVADCLTLPGV